MSVRILCGDCRDVLKTLPEQSVHVCVTSPPYFGLRSYLQGGHPDKAREIGAEPTVAEYVETLVGVFREVRRVLRDDGCCFVVLGDSYVSSPPGNVRGVSERSGLHGVNGPSDNYRKTLMAGHATKRDTTKAGIPAKNLCLVPERFRIAAQEDGWYVRSVIRWCKAAPMPESVRDRPTSAVEDVVLLTKSARYWWDQEAVREPNSDSEGNQARARAGLVKRSSPKDLECRAAGGNGQNPASAVPYGVGGRNPRNFMVLSPEPYPGSHFAVFPTAIPAFAIKAGSSERGVCPACGAGWVRVVERGEQPKDRQTGRGFLAGIQSQDNWPSGTPTHSGLGNAEYIAYQTVGWSPGCTCDGEWITEEVAGPPVNWSDDPDHKPGVTVVNGEPDALSYGLANIGRRRTVRRFVPGPNGVRDPIPATVLDPFGGAGTTGLVADRLGRDAILVELNPTYSAMSANRITGDAPLFAQVTTT